MYIIHNRKYSRDRHWFIGLSVVKEITVANDGEISVNSIWGKGSEFIVTFPISDIGAIE